MANAMNVNVGNTRVQIKKETLVFNDDNEEMMKQEIVNIDDESISNKT